MLRERKKKVKYITLIKVLEIVIIKIFRDMKTWISMVILLLGLTAFSQEQRVDFEKLNNDFIKATYYFANNDSMIEREGFFNKEGKLDSTWVSYDMEGNKTIIAIYKNGKKDGVWTYFKKDKLSLVTYKDNEITNVEVKTLVVN